MAILFKSFQSVLEDKNNKRLYYPRVICTSNVSTSQLAKEIAAYSSLSTGDVKNTLDNLVTVVSQHLQASESVTIDGFGTFRIAMKSNGNGVETADKVSASQATLTVRFSPACTRNLDGTIATRSLVTGAKCIRFDLAETSASGDGESGGDNTGSETGGSGNTGGSGSGEETPDPAA